MAAKCDQCGCPALRWDGSRPACEPGLYRGDRTDVEMREAIKAGERQGTALLHTYQNRVVLIADGSSDKQGDAIVDQPMGWLDFDAEVPPADGCYLTMERFVAETPGPGRQLVHEATWQAWDALSGHYWRPRRVGAEATHHMPLPGPPGQ